MGFFSFLDKPFRTGKTQALQQQKLSAESNRELNEGFFELVKPFVEQGQKSFERFNELNTPDGLGGLLNDIQNSGFADSLIDTRQEAATQALSSSGLRRSGFAAKTAAEIPTEVLLGLVNDIVNNTARSSQIGLSASNPSLSSIGGISNANNDTAQAFADQASSQGSLVSSIVNLGVGALGGPAGIAGKLGGLFGK